MSEHSGRYRQSNSRGGRGRGGRGYGGAGRGGGGHNKKSNNSKLQKLFQVNGSGQGYAAFSVTKEALIFKLQSKYGEKIAETIRTKTKYDFDANKPRLEVSKSTDADTKKTEDEENKMTYQEELKLHLAEKRKYNDDLVKVYGEIMKDWCTDAMKRRIDESKLSKKMIHNNPVELLVEIQRISHQPARAVYEYSALLNTMKRCLNLKQADKESLSDYQERFKQERNAMKAAMGTRFLDDFVELTDEYLSTTDADVHEKMKKEAVDKLMAVMFLENADRRIYGELIDSYVLDFANNNNLYPKTISSAIHVMSKVKPKKRIDA